MKSKKALLLGEHVVNIIVAVLCILVLVYLGFQIYNLYLGAKQEKEEAKYTLEMIIGVIQEIKKDGEEITKPIVNPKNWYILYFEKASAPKQCAGGSCLCICKGPLECQKNGVCQNIDNLEVIGECRIDESRDTFGKYLYSPQKNCIKIYPPMYIIIKKENQKVVLETEKVSSERSVLLDILNYKSGEKTMKEMIIEELQKYESGGGIEKSKLENPIIEFLDSKSIYSWKFLIIEKSNQKEILTLKQNSIAIMGETPQTEIIKVNDKEYEICLTIP